jgi:hypothetical protein
MNTKKIISENRNSLRGLTLQMVNENSVTPYNTLKEFGNAFLKEEGKGNDIYISQVWTSAGIVPVNSNEQVVELIKSGLVSAIQFVSKRVYNTVFELIGTTE